MSTPQMVRLFIQQGTLPGAAFPVEPGTKYILRGKGSDLVNCVPQVGQSTLYTAGTVVDIASSPTVQCVIYSFTKNNRVKNLVEIVDVQSGQILNTKEVDLTASYADAYSYYGTRVFWDSVNSRFALLMDGFDPGTSMRNRQVAYFDPTSASPIVPTYVSLNAELPTSPGPNNPVVHTNLVVGGVPYMILSWDGNARIVTINMTTWLNHYGPGGSYKATATAGGYYDQSTRFGHGKNGTITASSNSFSGFGHHIIDPINQTDYVASYTTPWRNLVLSFRPSFQGQGAERTALIYMEDADAYVFCCRHNDGQSNYFAFAFDAPASTTNGSTQAVPMKYGTILADSSNSRLLPQGIKTSGTNYLCYGLRTSLSGTTSYFGWKLALSSTLTVTKKTITPGFSIPINVVPTAVYNAAENQIMDIQWWDTHRVFTVLDGDMNFVTKTMGSDHGRFLDVDIVDLPSQIFTQAFSALYIPPESSDVNPTPISVLLSDIQPMGKNPDKNFMINIQPSRGMTGNQEGQLIVVGQLDVSNMASGCVLTGAGTIYTLANF